MDGMDGWVGERIGGDSSGEMGRLDSETAQGKARGLATGAAVAWPGSCHGAWPACPSPGSPQVNAFCRHHGQEVSESFTENGVPALGD